jgi:hypothetical protein
MRNDRNSVEVKNLNTHRPAYHRYLLVWIEVPDAAPVFYCIPAQAVRRAFKKHAKLYAPIGEPIRGSGLDWSKYRGAAGISRLK